jgi:Zn-dependent protease with chaperone function
VLAVRQYIAMANRTRRASRRRLRTSQEARLSTARSAARRPDSWAVAALASTVLFVPVWLAALAVFWFALRLVLVLPFWLFALGHLALGLTLLSRTMQRVFLARLLGARRPTPAEHRLLEPLWQEVLLRTRLSPAHFVLAVSDSDELNAFAGGGNLVVVTTGAMRGLPGRELQGVLAHEVGHHLGLYGVALTIGYWLALPAMALARIGFFLQNVAQAATDSFARGSSVLTVAGTTLSLLLRAVAWLFLLGVMAWQAVGGVVARSAELRADERAVELGFGRELAAAMRRSAVDEPSAASRTRADKVFGAHPPIRTRIARVEALTRRARARRDERAPG